MAETVFLFGAGINRCVHDWDNLRPPLSTDLFKQALKHPRIGEESYRQKIRAVYEFIQRHWKLSVEELKSVSFDIEACYTLLDLQAEEARSRGDNDTYRRLVLTQYQLTMLLAEYLSEFEHTACMSESFQKLGQILYEKKPAIITFNYDTLLESVIQAASGVNPNVPSFLGSRRFSHGEVPDEELAYSHYNWNRTLGYGVEFDEVQLHRAGVLTFVSGERFYANPQNQMYDWSLLKLHGSINWFQYTGIQRWPTSIVPDPEAKAGKTLLHQATWWFNEWPQVNGQIIEPIIVTPMLHKDLRQGSIIPKLWKLARIELSECRRLIVGGYSFPPTDFYAKRLFLEAFEYNSPEEVIVINPDTSVVQLVKDLCHFNKPVLVCRDLDEFVIGQQSAQNNRVATADQHGPEKKPEDFEGEYQERLNALREILGVNR